MNSQFNNQFNGFNQFNGMNTQNTVLPPIVTRQTNVVHRYFLIDQPHICENETKVINHYVKRHYYIPRDLCCEENTYSEQNCGSCNQCGRTNNQCGCNN